MRYLALWICFMVSLHTYAQSSVIIAKIEKINELKDAYHQEQYENFLQLKELAGKEELMKLTNHPNGVVRCYAFWALTEDPSVDLFPFIKAHIQDDTLVETHFGCIGGKRKVGDILIDFIVRVVPEDLDTILLARIDSLLIFAPNNLAARFDALRRAVPSERFYSRIRDLVIKERNGSALEALAKYRKQQDVELILQYGQFESDRYYHTYCAMSHFPDTAFRSFLEHNFYITLEEDGSKYEWYELYAAIASYQDEKTLELFKMAFTRNTKSIKKGHIQAVFEALQRFPHPVYDELLWTLWTDENLLSTGTFRYLSARDAKRALVLAERSLLDLDDLNYDPYGPENLILMMLDTVIGKDRRFAVEIIRKNIQTTNVQQFEFFTSRVGKTNDTSFIEPLFARLEKEDNPYIYLRSIEALITYQDAAINQRILNVRKKNTRLWNGWGAQALDKLLKENNI